ncbi:preprotein translocase subunit SecE [Serinibacter arcticus]|jgi:preprotein translocase subunit SecE|uniref:Protein translocase subunit SecE n=1 Tax=Serinibacter arcticus TaxID=1655435 RepID=A0A4Z1E2T4_9MICO|nr:preprotein translocase subunit SecE [Serinibacter arcticus]TGO06355.1 Preprotein translocase subunit SecE [Serinibacter arcticus]
MSESSTTAAGKPEKSPQELGFFGRIVLFVRQVIAELRKVVTPTRPELLNYTLVVLVFILVCMAFVFVLDFGIGRLVLWMLGTPGS